mmetsp:Transcript_100875/g.323772  ORF Transcript_100875/g.323772 Transcript_100875/m.323772 type:complete len:646 (-) Transcript_100875:161-2098(-)
MLALLPQGADLNAKSSEGLWTPLHAAATRGHAQVASTLLARGVDTDAVDAGGHTALAISAARGHCQVVGLLLEAAASPDVYDAQGHTPLHFATLAGHDQVVSLLLQHHANIDAVSSDGATALVAALVVESRWPVASVLLAKGASTNVRTHSRGLVPLMQVVTHFSTPTAATAITELLRCAADANCRDRFGATALHAACRRGAGPIVKALCDSGADIRAQDDDGLYPLQLLLEKCAQQPEEDSELVTVALAALLAADPGAANAGDFGESTPLHSLCLHAGLQKTAPLKAIRALLAASADPTAEEEGGWTPMHFAAQQGGEASAAMLQELRSALAQSQLLDFWSTLDLQKARDTSNRKYLARRGGHNRIPLEDRRDVLRGDVTIAGVAERLRSGRSRRVVALIGAGVSTSAGVPDFRSPGTGLWAQESMRNIFSLEGFVSQPEGFWSHASDTFLGRTPTKFHRLLVRLHTEGMLHRVYTQNIDNLEVDAGIPAELVVGAHGNITRTVCHDDPSHETGFADIHAIREHIAAGKGTPRCAACASLVRPDVVFFGEPLPASFSKRSGLDFSECDLLIVAGTTLTVYPVAGLVNQVQPLVPRLLINRDPTGLWRGSSVVCGEGAAYRDAFYQGGCDEGAEELARLMGWDLH